MSGTTRFGSGSETPMSEPTRTFSDADDQQLFDELAPEIDRLRALLEKTRAELSATEGARREWHQMAVTSTLAAEKWKRQFDRVSAGDRCKTLFQDLTGTGQPQCDHSPGHAGQCASVRYETSKYDTTHYFGDSCVPGHPDPEAQETGQ